MAADPLFRAYPGLAREIDRLCELLPWQMTGASALALEGDALVLELTKPKHWRTDADGATIVGVGAIGGSLEPGETLLGCLQREAHEELGARLEILPAQETCIVYEREQVTRLALGSGEHPAPAVMTVSENLYRPELGPAARTLGIATFWGRLDAEPRLGDLYGILRVPPGQVEAALRGLPCTPAQLAAIPGVRFETRSPLASRARLEPVWTVHSLWRILQQGMLPGRIEL